MAKLGRTGELVAAEELLDEAAHFVDLAVRLRVLRADGRPGRLLPDVIGGRWDTWTSSWVSPAPADLKVAEWTVQEQQIQILLGLPAEILLVAIFAGRQAGKTRAALMQIAIDAARWPGMASFVVSLDYKASREPEEAFRTLLPPEWGVVESKTDRTFTWPHGHVVAFRSAEAIDSCRGPSTKSVLLDEASRMAHEVYMAAIGGGVASKDFRLYISTTPKRECEWIRKVDQTWATQPDSRVIRLRTDRNPRRNEALLRRLKEDTPADLYEQEFEGKLVSPRDAVYGRLFRRSLHLRPPGKLPDAVRFSLQRVPVNLAKPDGPQKPREPWDYTREFTRTEYGKAAGLLMGWDFGKEAVVVGRIFREAYESVENKRRKITYRDRLWIVGEAVNENTTTDHHAGDVADAWGTEAIVITDAMGAYDRSDGRGKRDSAAIEILNEAGFLHVEPIARRNPEIEQRVRTVSRALLSAKKSDVWPEGEIRLFIAPGTCPRLEDALENQRMKDGKPDKDGKHEHVLDALGYLVCGVMPIVGALPDGFTRAAGDDQ